MRKNGKGRQRKAVRICIALLVMGILLQSIALASGNANGGRVVVNYKDGNFPLAGVEFSVYHVAERTGEHGYAATAEFAGCPVEKADELDGDELRMLTETLTGHILKNSLEPEATSVTDADGRVEFAGLGDGLYLISGAPYSNGKTSWFCEDSLVGVPERFGAWEFGIEPKSEHRDEEKIDIKVMKIWSNDDAHKSARAEEIEVELYCNGNLYDTVKLNETNSWRHMWNGLDGLAEWHAAEITDVKGYSTQISRNEYEIVITNTYEEEEPEPGGRLPQTGLLWWPVPLLLAAGIILFAAGVIRRRKSGGNGE